MIIETEITRDEYESALRYPREMLARRLAISDRRAGELKSLCKNGTRSTVSKWQNPDWKKYLIMGDFHGEFADEGMLHIADGVVRDWQPDHVVLAGDIINCDWARLRRPASSDWSPDEELDWLVGIIDRYGADYVLLGNHEGGIDRLSSDVPKTWQKFFNIEKYCTRKLPDRSIKWFPYKSTGEEVLTIGHLKVVHGWWMNMHCAKKHSEAYGNCIHFHAHRHQTYSSLISNKKQTGWSVGAMCLTHLPYDLEMAPRNHVQGFATVYANKSTGDFVVHNNLVIGDTAIIEGREYSRHD